MSNGDAKPPREIVVINKSEGGPPPGFWSGAERVSKVLSIAAIPVVVAVGGWQIQKQLQDQTVKRDYVQMAIGILQEPDEKKVGPAMRQWATDLLKENSPTSLPEELLNDLRTGQTTLPTSLFVAPRTTRGGASGDGSAAVVVAPDGSAVSLLLDSLGVDLQKPADKLIDEVKTELTMEIVNSDPPVLAIKSQLRGFVSLSDGARATITVTVGSSTSRYEYPFGKKEGLTIEGGLYSENVFKEASTRLTWSVPVGRPMKLPVSIKISAERKTPADIALVQVDSVDAIADRQ